MTQRDDPTSSAPVVDWEVARLKLPGGAEGIREVASLVSEEARTLAAAIRRAADSGDAKEFALKAHTLRGGALHFGEVAVVHLATRLQRLAKEGRLAEAAQALPELDECVRRLCEELARVDERLAEAGSA